MGVTGGEGGRWQAVGWGRATVQGQRRVVTAPAAALEAQFKCDKRAERQREEAAAAAEKMSDDNKLRTVCTANDKRQNG